MTPFGQALETSILLAEKIASARPPSAALREKQALADFAAFGLFKRAAIDPAALSALQRGLGWGVGLGLPALGVGHLMLGDAQRHSGEVLRDARNQALMTAAGVGGMQALGNLLAHRGHADVAAPSDPRPPTDLDSPQKLAAAILVDDVLEAACALSDPAAKHAALVRLIVHRGEGARLLRSMLA